MNQKFTIICALLGVLILSGALFAQAGPDTVTIYDLQYVPDPVSNDLSPLQGDTVIVKGLVMHYPRELWVGARWAVHIVDPDSFPNPWSGFFIIQSDTFQIQTNFQFVEPGMICYFRGIVAEFANYSQVQIFGDGYFPDPVIPISIVSTGNPLPDPVVVTAENLDGRANAEQWESMWTRVENASVVNNAVSGNWASITDASGGTTFMGEYFNSLRDPLNAGTYTWPANGTRLSVNGFIRDESAGYNTNPRDTSDLELLSDPPQITNALRSPGAPTPGVDVTVSANIVDNGTIASANVVYSVNWGAFQPISMTAAGDNYSAVIPPLSEGDFVRYFIEATDNDAESSSQPGDTSLTGGSVLFYTVRSAGNLKIMDVQYTYGYGGSDASGYVGYAVTLKGVVMSDSTDFFSGDYYIQEKDSAWSGIWINDDLNSYAKGDLVEVTGMVEENFNVTRIDEPTQSQVITPSVGAYDPVLTTTGDITTNGPMAEAFESVLIRVENLTVTNPFADAPSNFGEFEVDDGSGAIRVDDLAAAFRGNLDSTYALNDPIAAMIGLGYFSFGNAKIIPRDTMDVIGHVTGIEDIAEVVPDRFMLEQNYPNPFNPTTTIKYAVSQNGEYSIFLYNILGQKIRELANTFHLVGQHQAVWDGKDEFGKAVGSGVYFYRLSGKDVSITKKMILMK